MPEEQKLNIDDLLNDKKKFKQNRNKDLIGNGESSFSLINTLVLVQIILLINNIVSTIIGLSIIKYIAIYSSLIIMPILILVLTIFAFYDDSIYKDLKNYIIVWASIIFNFFFVLINHYYIISNLI